LSGSQAIVDAEIREADDWEANKLQVAKALEDKAAAFCELLLEVRCGLLAARRLYRLDGRCSHRPRSRTHLLEPRVFRSLL
jgi:hypothetical protein